MFFSNPSARLRLKSFPRCFLSAFLATSALFAMAAKPGPQTADISTASRAQIAQNYVQLPLSFEANQGQTSPQVRFLSRGRGYSLFLTDSAAVVSLTGPSGATSAIRMELAGALPHPGIAGPRGDDRLPGAANYFLGNDQSKWRTNVPTYAKVRYAGIYPGIDLVYYGNQGQLEYDFVVAPHSDPHAIQLAFAGAEKLNLTPQGDLAISTPNGQIAFEKPTIYQRKNGQRQPVEGRFSLLAKNTVGFTLGQYDHALPLVIDPVLAYSTFLGGAGYYENAGGSGHGAVGGAATQIAVDASGDAYIVGSTSVVDFPVTAGAFQTAPNGAGYNSASSSYDGDVYGFVAKLDPTGSKLLYSTYFGGRGQPNEAGDIISSIFVDAAGNAYLAGAANSNDFPVTAGAFQTINNTGGNFPNGFVSKLNPTGNALLYSTYIGGYGGDPIIGDACTHVVANAAGNAYVTGYTTSSNFPVTPGAFQTTSKAYPSAFVAEFNPTGTGLVYSTLLSGSKAEFGTSLAVDATGNAYVTGVSASTDFPVTAHGYERINKAEVAHTNATGFVAKLNPAGSSLLYATYLGGTGSYYGMGGGAVGLQYGSLADWPNSLAIDSAGDVYVSGITISQDFPTTATAFQKTNKTYANKSGPEANSTVFVTKLNPTLSALLYSTYLGSSNGEPVPGSIASISGGTYGAGSLAVDTQNNIYLTGTTYGSDFPVTANALQPVNHAARQNGEGDASPNAFVAEIGANGKLLYSTYLGGSGQYPGAGSGENGDYGASIALDPSGDVYVTGTAQSFDFPVTAGAYQTGKTTQASAFVAKFNMTAVPGTATTTELASSDNPQLYAAQITFTALVESIGGDGTPTGSVTFSVNGNSQSVALDTTGQATYAVTGLPTGSYVVKASYAGDATHAASSGQLTQVVAGKPASITLVSGNNQTAALRVNALNPIVVVVKDAKGLPVPGVPVSYGRTSGSIFYVDIGWNSYTDSKGEAEIGVYGTSVGTFSEAVSVSQVTTPAFFSLKVTAQVAAPQINFPSVFSATQTVTITDATAGATIYYTTNGLPPTIASTKYKGPIPISQTTTFKAIAVLSGQGNSDVAFGTFTVPAAPVFSLASGVYAKTQTVTITDLTAGATIYYTTNGASPTIQNSTIYSGPITVSTATVVQAFALSNFVASPVSQAAYEVGGYTPGYSLGAIETVGGKPHYPGLTGNGGLFLNAEINSPQSIIFDATGNLYIAEIFNQDIRKVDAKTGKISTVAGKCVLVNKACAPNYAGDGGLATAAQLAYPQGIAVDTQGNLYIADSSNNRVRMVAAATGIITTIAGNGTAGNSGDTGKATSAELDDPTGLAVDSLGNLYISCTTYSVVRKVVLSTGIISTVAGTGKAGYGGDNGPASKATLSYNAALALDSTGNLYIVDGGNNLVRKFNVKTGVISTIAGHCQSPTTGACGYGYTGDGGKATAAELDNPNGIAFDASGNLYIADLYNNVVRQVNTKTGIITTAAGNGYWSGQTRNTYGTGGFTGDGGPAVNAELDDPAGVAIDAGGNLFIADYWNSIVRKVTPAN